MSHNLFVSQPYREVCLSCKQRRQVVAVHFPADLAGETVRSTRLCRACAADLARKLSAALPLLMLLEETRR